MHSLKEINGKFWTACSECEKGGNGSYKDKCSCGYRVKRWNGLGCFLGILMDKYKKDGEKL